MVGFKKLKFFFTAGLITAKKNERDKQMNVREYSHIIYIWHQHGSLLPIRRYFKNDDYHGRPYILIIKL